MPVEEFFDNPVVADARVSPDGRWLSYRKPWKGTLNLYVRPLHGPANTERRVTSDTARGADGYFWAQDGSRILYVEDTGGNENFHVYAVFLAERITAPLLVVQGANDPRVPQREGDPIVVALRDRGVRVRYLVAPNEGYGFANADNRMALYRSIETFFGEHLGGRVAPTTRPETARRIAALSVNIDTLRLTPPAIAHPGRAPGAAAPGAAGRP